MHILRGLGIGLLNSVDLRVSHVTGLFAAIEALHGFPDVLHGPLVLLQVYHKVLCGVLFQNAPSKVLGLWILLLVYEAIYEFKLGLDISLLILQFPDIVPAVYWMLGLENQRCML